ncbi:unnamed protein product, partial [Notodromas monacha]
RINKPSDLEKTVIFIESQIHAREWITSATTTWIFNEILNNPEYASVLDEFDFHFVPVVNPDGVAYTHTNDRLWRKTRSPNDNGCFGADPNRNWDASFGGPGTSDDPCSEIYHGASPFSESEVKAVSDYILENSAAIAAFFDIHSYSQLVLLPWGDSADLPEDYDELYRVGKIFQDHVAILYGTEYITGNIADVIYLAAGGSVDWVKATAQVKYSHALELRDTGDYGFLLPPSQIIPSGEETLLGLLAQLSAIRSATIKIMKSAILILCLIGVASAAAASTTTAVQATQTKGVITDILDLFNWAVGLLEQFGIDIMDILAQFLPADYDRIMKSAILILCLIGVASAAAASTTTAVQATQTKGVITDRDIISDLLAAIQIITDLGSAAFAQLVDLIPEPILSILQALFESGLYFKGSRVFI